MEVTLTIPDNVASELLKGTSITLSRRVLELAAVKAYELDIFTEWQVIEMLGLEGRIELHALFKRYKVRDHNYTMN